MPHRELLLLLSYGRAAVRLEMLSGTRIHETMQARQGGGCFLPKPIGGKGMFTMLGRPKGWEIDRRWVLHPRTMGHLRAMAAQTVAMWYSDIGTLPLVDYGLPQKNVRAADVPCPAARYLFQIGGRAMTRGELNLCIRLATLGIAAADSHDYRYVFGRLLSVRKATRAQRASAGSHSPRSASVDRYGAWDCPDLDEADDIVAAMQNEMDEEMIDDLLHAA